VAKKRKIAGPGRLGSIKAAKRTLAKKGGDKRVRTIPAENEITCRFLTEPMEFHGYYEHWNQAGERYDPCIEGDCEYCASGVRRTFRYLGNAYVVDDSAVKAVKMPKTVFEQLMARYMKDGTIMDRDFELSRTGSGRDDTVYMVSPDSPRKVKLSRFTLLDLDEVLQSMVDDMDEADDDEDDEPKRKSKKSKSKREEKSPWDDDDEDDEEEEDEDEDERPRRTSASSKKRTVKKSAPKRVVKKTTARKTGSVKRAGSKKVTKRFR
jgi:hypothetical protein